MSTKSPKRSGTYMESQKKKRRRSVEGHEDAPGAASDGSGPSRASEDDTGSSTSSDEDSPEDAKSQSGKSTLLALDFEEDSGSDNEPLDFTTPSTSRISIKPRQDLPKRTSSSFKRQETLEDGVPHPSALPAASDFASLGVSAALVSSLAAMSIRKPTPVQSACIPQLIAGEANLPYPFYPLINSSHYISLGQDCVGNAKTGSGKTVAFAVPILQQLAKDPYGLFALVLTPTRSERLALSWFLDSHSCSVIDILLGGLPFWAHQTGNWPSR